MGRNYWQWLEMAGIARMAGNALKWLVCLKIAGNGLSGLKRLYMVVNG